MVVVVPVAVVVVVVVVCTAGQEASGSPLKSIMVSGCKVIFAPGAKLRPATGWTSAESATVYSAPSNDGRDAIAMPIGVPAEHGTPIDHICASTHSPSVAEVQLVSGTAECASRRSTAAAAGATGGDSAASVASQLTKSP